MKRSINVTFTQVEILAVIAIIVTVLLPQTMLAAERQPNIVFILADDLGWKDTAPYGSDFYPTPNIARLAQQGIKFTNAYAASPLCSPTRSSIMTGLYPARIGITAPACAQPQEILEKQGVQEKAQTHIHALPAITLTRLKLEYKTLAESLHDAGYATGHFGKWHLGRDPYNPQNQGFDVDVPHWYGPNAPGYIAPWKFPPAIKFQANKPEEHIEDRMAEEAVKFLEANKDKPFFLNYWAFSIHGPWQAKKELIEHYEAKIDPNKRQKNPVYAAMVHSLDDAVGKLLDTLDRLKLTENTIVVFFSDNGGVVSNERYTQYPELTSNYPLRAGKSSVYEGGTREPFIVSWAGHIKPGTQSEEVVQSVDFYPTFLDILGLKADAGQKFDGISILPALKGEKLERDAIYCHFPHTTRLGDAGSWVRQGDWKLLRFYCGNDDLTDKYELYNLKDDISESSDLVSKYPDRIVSMKRLLDSFLADTAAVIPQPNPRFDVNAKAGEKTKK